MSNYKPKCSYSVGKFQLDVYPYVAPPENRFDQNVAIQYGSDFKVTFTRGATTQGTKIGLLQLIFPRTQLFPHTTVGAWNVDRQARATSLLDSLYGNDGTQIGNHSEYYKGDPMRKHSATECYLIDTPREINSRFSPPGSGTFTGITSTKFADYVVELKGPNSKVFDGGIVWGYSVLQNASNPAEFDVTMQPPKSVKLSQSNEHLTAVASFLGQTPNQVRSLIAN